MIETYKWLFPFENVPHGSHVLIYGAGDVGQAYLKQLLMTGYAKVVGILDRAYDSCPLLVVPVYAPAEVRRLEYDFVVLAFKVGSVAADVRHFLLDRGVPEDKIVFIGSRNESSIIADVAECNQSVVYEKSLAFQRSTLSIALKFGPGLGDAVIKKSLVMELARMAPESKIDIYAPNLSNYISSLYSDVKQFNQAIDDGGVLYTQYHKEYGLSMSVFYVVLTDHIKYDKLHSVNPSFAESMRQHIENHRKYGVEQFPASQNSIHFARARYRGYNCYTLYNYTNVFHIKDMSVPIPLHPAYMKKFQKLQLGKYVTLNFGNGIGSAGNKQSISKQWPKEHFIRFIEFFHQRFPDIKVQQLGDKTVTPLAGVDGAFLGKDLELVKYILRGSLCHLDIEGGLMHLATQLGVRCVALFGPTQVHLFGYPQNINLTGGDCQGCYCLYENNYQCARGLDKPTCMSAITPEMAMEAVGDVLTGRR